MTEHHDEWYTYPESYLEYCETYEIFPTLDVAAHKDSYMCDNYFTKEDDALTKEWTEDFWMNPPLLKGMTKKFTLYAVEQVWKHDVNGLCIIPAGSFVRKWFRPIWDEFIVELLNGKKRVFIDPIKRPSFMEYGKPVEWSARNDYMMLVLRAKN